MALAAVVLVAASAALLPGPSAVAEEDKPAVTSDPTSDPAPPVVQRPVSMSAEEFGRLSPADQRALLVRVFQRRLEHVKNLFYEVNISRREYEDRDGEPGRLITPWYGGWGPVGSVFSGQGALLISGAPEAKPLPVDHVQCRHWRLGDSFRMDAAVYVTGSKEPIDGFREAVDAEAGVRKPTTRIDAPGRALAEVSYPSDIYETIPYVCWLDGKHDFKKDPIDLRQTRKNLYLFRYLLSHADEFEIHSPVEGDKVQLTVNWRACGGEDEHVVGKRVLLLDPRKGFLPIRGELRWDMPPAEPGGERQWHVETLVVEESRLVGDVWMPIKLAEKTSASHHPGSLLVARAEVTRIEYGKVKPADLVVRFTEGMEVTDCIRGARYVADAEGKPAGPVEPAPNWKHDPPPAEEPE